MARAADRAGLFSQLSAVMHFNVRVVTSDGRREGVVLQVGPENNALGERIGGRAGRRVGRERASRQIALVDAAIDGGVTAIVRGGPSRRIIRVVDAARLVAGDQAVDLVKGDFGLRTTVAIARLTPIDLLIEGLRDVDERAFVAVGADQRADIRSHCRWR